MKKQNSEKQLHTNYVRLAKILHPDLNHNSQSEKLFQELNQNYKKALELFNQYQATIKISLKEAIEGTERYFINDNDQKFVLVIPAGIKNNQIIHFRGIDINSKKNIILHIKTIIELPKKYSIINDNLVSKEKIPIYKLFMGGKYSIIGPDGKKIVINLPRKIKIGKLFKISNSGLWNIRDNKRDPLFILIYSKLI